MEPIITAGQDHEAIKPGKLCNFLNNRNTRIALLVVSLAVIFWLAESTLDVWVLPRPGTFLERVLYPSVHELWVRLLVITLLALFAFYSGRKLSQIVEINEVLKTEVAGRRRVEPAFSRLIAKYELILNSAAEGIIGVDSEGKVVFANLTAARLTGYELQELCDQHHAVLHENKPEGSTCIKGPCPFCAVLLNNESIRTEDIFCNREGKSYPVEYVASPVHEDGHLAGAVVLFRDISVRQQARRELQRANEFLENIFDNSADLFGIVDRQGRIVRWNKAASEFYGYSHEEIKNKHFAGMYADKTELDKMLARLRRDGFVRRYEINMKKKDGSIIPFALSITLLRDAENNLIGSFCVARDRSEIRKNLGELKTVNDRLQEEVAERKQVEAALQKANNRQQGMLAELEQRNREITLLNQMGDLLQACVACQEAFAGVAHFMSQLFPAESGALYMLNPSKNLAEVVAAWGDKPPREVVFHPEECWALRLGEVHTVHQSISGLVCRHITGPRPAGHLCVPLTASGEIQGMLALFSYGSQPESPESLTQADQRLAVTAAKQISLALANLRLRDTLHAQAVRDPLTGLFNRRYLEETLLREMSRIKRKSASLAILMLDLDHFKLINDNFGHDAGDAMLVAVGKLLRENVRQEDIPCRYGGEEFTLIMPETTAETARHRADRLRRLIRKLRLHDHGEQLMKITASVGVAICPDHGETAEDVLRAADAALYLAKQMGRDCVVQAFDGGVANPASVAGLDTGPAPKKRVRKSTAAECKPPSP